MRAQFIDTDRVRFEVSVNASQPVRSNSNEARQGMPNLLGSFEVGPAVVVNLARSSAAASRGSVGRHRRA